MSPILAPALPTSSPTMTRGQYQPLLPMAFFLVAAARPLVALALLLVAVTLPLAARLAVLGAEQAVRHRVAPVGAVPDAEAHGQAPVGEGARRRLDEDRGRGGLAGRHENGIFRRD